MRSTPVMNIENADLLNFQVKSPAFELTPWVDCYYAMQHVTTNLKAPPRNLHPDGGATLVFDFLDTQGVKTSIHFQQRRREVRFTQSLDCVAIRFSPGGAFALLGLSADDIQGSETEALATNAELKELSDRLSSAYQPEYRFRLIEDFLRLSAQRLQLQQGIVQHWLHALPLSPQEIRQQLERKGIARRRLERTFRIETGFSPGQLYNLRRLQAARQLLVAQPLLPLTAIAQHYGFYDQAHFIHQFSNATGNNPSQYRQRKLSQFYNSK